MIAPSTMTRKMPVKSAGNSSALMVGITVSGSSSNGNRARPAIPVNTAPRSNSTMHTTATRPPRTSSRPDAADMNRVRS